MSLKIAICCCNNLFGEGIKRLLQEECELGANSTITIGTNPREVIQKKTDLLITDFNTLAGIIFNDNTAKHKVRILLFGTGCLPKIENECLISFISLLPLYHLLREVWEEEVLMVGGPGKQYCMVYKPDTVETFSGEVISIEKIAPRKGMFYGVHLMVKTEEKTISVHLGPGWHIENQSITIEPEDKVVVKGSRITFEGKPAIIAAEVNKGEEILKLRDENGFPAWSGWRRR